jgi:hypothetical protein
MTMKTQKIKSYFDKSQHCRINSHFANGFHLFTSRNFSTRPNGAGIYKDGKKIEVSRDYVAQVLRAWRRA